MAENLRVSLIQTFLHWENKEKNLRHFDGKIDQIESTDLILLPEMFNTGFSMNSAELCEPMHGPTVNWMKEKAAEKSAVVCGSLIVEENGKFFNRLIWMRPEGSFETYDKRHLFRMADEEKYFSPGNKRLIVELKGWRIFPQICYDLRFPVYSRNNFSNKGKFPEAEYDLAFYIANWPAARVNAWSTLLKARAIENQASVIGVNRIGEDGNQIAYNGQSAVIDAKGESMFDLNDSDKIVTTQLNMQELEDFRKKFPVGMDRDEFRLC